MKNLSIVLFAVGALTSVGCKKKGGAGDAMAKMSELKDKMCGCKDKKCADDVQDQMNKWSAESAKNAGDKPEKPDEKTMKEMQDVGTKYGECMAKAMSGGGDAAGSATAAGSAAPAAGSAAPAAAGGAGCVDGAYKDPQNRYCVKLPDGFSAPEKLGDTKYDQSMDVFHTETGSTFSVKVYYKGDFESEKSTHGVEGNGFKVTDKGDLPGGGYFVMGRREEDKESYVTALVKAGEKVIMCESQSNDPEPIKPADACKSIRAM